MLNVQQWAEIRRLHFIERRESVLLVGPAGVGKTHLAQAIGHAACIHGRSVLFDKTARVLSDLGRLDGTWERRLHRYLAPDLVILDDLGLRAFTERQGEDLYELVSERVRRSSTIVTSNRPPSDGYALFPNPVLAEGALDRLINSGADTSVAAPRRLSSDAPLEWICHQPEPQRNKV